MVDASATWGTAGRIAPRRSAQTAAAASASVAVSAVSATRAAEAWIAANRKSQIMLSHSAVLPMRIAPIGVLAKPVGATAIQASKAIAVSWQGTFFQQCASTRAVYMCWLLTRTSNLESKHGEDEQCVPNNEQFGYRSAFIQT